MEPSHLEKEIAYLLETEPDLLTFIPELLEDLQSLGGSPDMLVALLKEHVCPRAGWHILDLGCGKGALSLATAEAFSCRTLGVDAFLPFIEAARIRTNKLGLDGLCRFENRDLRTELEPDEPYHGVIYSALGDLLGSPSETVGFLGGTVRDGGFMFIDDVYLKPGAKAPPGYEYTFPREEMHQALTAHGDRIIAEKTLTTEALRSMNRRNTDLIKRRAESLARRYPDKALSIDAYVQRQEDECANLESELVCAGWLLERGPHG